MTASAAGPGDAGTVYLLHLEPAYRHARHYIGWTRDLPARLQAHRDGQGARLMEVVKQAGGSFRLVRTWPGSRDRERAIKDRHEAPKLCPVTGPWREAAHHSAAQTETMRGYADLIGEQLMHLRQAEAEATERPFEQAPQPETEAGR